MNSLLMTAENGLKTYRGIKTQTRRMTGLEYPNSEPGAFELIQQDGQKFFFNRIGTKVGGVVTCPFKVGERRYIRESHYLYGEWKRDGKTKLGAKKYRFVPYRDMGVRFPDEPPCCVCTKKTDVGWFRRPGMFMFEWAARTIVEITEVRGQRVQAISEADAIAEGVEAIEKTTDQSRQFYKSYRLSGDGTFCEQTARDSFMTLWESPDIHGAGAWERNDWVAAVTYRKVHR